MAAGGFMFLSARSFVRLFVRYHTCEHDRTNELILMQIIASGQGEPERINFGVTW